MRNNSSQPRINYVTQMNAFRERILCTPGMKAGTISVYYALLHINNLCHWAPEFEVDFGYVLALSKVDKSTYYKALGFLKDNDLLESYTKGANNYSKARVILKVLSEKSLGITESNQEVDSEKSLSVSVGMSDSIQNNIETVNIKGKTINIKQDVCENSDLINLLVSDFGFTEMRFAPQQKTIMQFVINLEHKDQVAHFINQYSNYKEYKKLAQEKIHGFKAFIGAAANQFNDGCWDAENWKHKIEALRAPINQRSTFVM